MNGTHTPTAGRPTAGSHAARVCGIVNGLTDTGLHLSASRDSQVWPTAQRSGRCSIGIRRFKSCSLHSVTRPTGRVTNVSRFEPRESQRSSEARPTVSRRFKSCSLQFSSFSDQRATAGFESGSERSERPWFKSCSLHSVTRPTGRVTTVQTRPLPHSVATVTQTDDRRRRAVEQTAGVVRPPTENSTHE